MPHLTLQKHDSSISLTKMPHGLQFPSWNVVTLHCCLAKEGIASVIAAGFLEAAIVFIQHDALIMCLHNHAHCTWRAVPRLMCMSHGLICQGLFQWCCPDPLKAILQRQEKHWPLSFQWVSSLRWVLWYQASWATLLGRLCGPLPLVLQPCTPPKAHLSSLHCVLISSRLVC